MWLGRPRFSEGEIFPRVSVLFHVHDVDNLHYYGMAMRDSGNFGNK